MKRILILLCAFAAASGVRAGSRPGADAPEAALPGPDREETTPIDAVAVSDAGRGRLSLIDTGRVDFLLASGTRSPFPETEIVRPQIDPGERFRRLYQRFLPMRKRMDREIGKIKYAYRGEVILGLTASYGTLTSEETDYMLILDNINVDGSVTSIKPFFGYFYRDNNCIGARFGYLHIDGTLGNADLDLGEKNDISFSVSDMALSSNLYSFGLFHRSYAGLDPKGRFGLFAELELSYSGGSSYFAYKSGDEVKYTESDTDKIALSFNPGMAVYIFPNVCGTLSFGLGGVQYVSVKQYDRDGVRTGSRTASKMRFRLNLAEINIGLTIHLWDKKKK